MTENIDPHSYQDDADGGQTRIDPSPSGPSMENIGSGEAFETPRLPSQMESHQQLQAVFASINVGIAYLDRNFNFLRVNGAYAEANGEKPDYFIGKNHFELFPGDQAKASFQKVLDSGETFTAQAAPFSFPRYPERGVTYWNWSVQSLKDETGKVDGLILSTVDVTEQKRTELALLASREQLERQTALVKLLQDIAVAANEADTLETALQYALDRVCNEMGWPVGHALLQDPLIGVVSTHLWHLDDRESAAAFVEITENQDWYQTNGLNARTLAKSKASWLMDLSQDEYFARKREAAQAGLVAAISFPILIGKEAVGVLEFFSTQSKEPESGLIEMMAHVGTQLGRVFERERSRRALQHSEARFRTIFQQSAAGIQMTDVEGFIIETNPALQKMLGYSGEELHQLGLNEVIHPDDLERYWELLKPLLRGECEQYRTEIRCFCKDGSIIWVDLTVSSIKAEDNQPQFVVMLMRDITEMKRMEAELVEVQRKLLESSEMERLSLARELHDGPLQTLYGVSFQLQDLLTGLRDPHQVNNAANIQAILQQIISTLRNISGELRPPTLAPFGLEKAIRSHIDRYMDRFPNILVHLELMSDGQIFSEQARLALFRIYQQLVSNVTRHSTAKNMWVRLFLSDELVALEVEDDGQGFRVPDRPVDLARSGHTGLLRVIQMVEAFGGEIEIRTNEQGGSFVKVMVPRERVNQ